jgi:hypothetical protein
MHHYQRGRASIAGLMVELREIIETGRLVVVVMTRLVCAQHGHVVNGVQVPSGNTRNETKPPPEANHGRATDRVREPERSGERLPGGQPREG